MRRLHAEAGHFGDALHGGLVVGDETRHFLVKGVEMRFEESQFLEGQLEEPPVDGMERRAGAERVRNWSVVARNR